MDHRYLLAIPLPNDKKSQLDALYFSATSQHIPVETIHISVEFPLFLAARVTEQDFVSRVESMHFIPFTVSFVKLGVFTQLDKKILYAKAQPQEKFSEIHDYVRRELQEYYLLDTSVYTNQVVPMYEAHLTLSYDASFDELLVKKIEELLKGFSFTATQCEVYKEVEKGMWVTMGSNH